MKEYGRLNVSLLALMGAGFGGHAALAAETAQSTPSAEDTVIAEVLVSGRKPLNDANTVNVGAFGSKDVLDIPISIQTYSSELMENMRARTINDILANDSSIQNSAQGGAYDHIRIRGFSIDWTNTMRVDGLSLAPYQDVPLENVERVDVLKGPSGFLYGYNSPGGTVNYLVKRPTKVPFLSLTGELRSDDGYYAHADTSGTLGADERIGYRFNTAYDKVGDFTHAFDSERFFVSLNTDWKLSERALLQVNLDHQKKETAAQPLISVPASGELPPELDPDNLLAPTWLKYEADVYNVGVRLNYTLNDDWFVVAQGAYARNERVAAWSYIYELADNGDILDGEIEISPGQMYETLSGQLFLSGKMKTGSIGHETIFGISTRSYDAMESGYTVLPITVGNIYHPVYEPKPVMPPNRPKNKVDNTQHAVFVSDLVTFNEQWQALAGVRFISYENTLQRPTGPRAVPYKQDSWVPSVGLIYKPSPKITTYASYAEGLEQGGVAPNFTVNRGEYQDPIQSEQIELGVKTELTDWVTVTASLFEVEKGLEYVNSSNVYVQDGRQRHRGVELQAQGALTSRLFMTTGVTYLDTELLKTGDPLTEGKRTENVPKLQASVYADYALSSLPSLHLNGGIYYVGDRGVGAQNVAFIDAYTRVDFGASYRMRLNNGNPLVFRAQIKNVTDEFYWASTEYQSVWPSQPRTFYLSMQIDL